jgi:type III restriction enzyme
MLSLPVVQYDQELPEIPSRCAWEVPTYHLIKTPKVKGGWAIAPGRRPSKLLLIEKLRAAVSAWRDQGYPGVSAVTRRLLQYWFEEDHQVAGFPVPFRYHFGQREAVETLIYVVEVCGHRDAIPAIEQFGTIYGTGLFEGAGYSFQTLTDGTRQIRRYVAETDSEQTQDLSAKDLRRHAFKMATGSGKTWVMALCIVWCYYRQREGASGAAADLGLSTNFLIVSPNVIVHQRLERDFDGNKIFNQIPLVPPEWGKMNLKVIKRGDFTEPDAGGNLFITNIHQLYEGRDQPATPANAIEALLGTPVKKDGINKGRSMLERIKSLKGIVVLNDEAHHVHDSDLEWHRSLMAIHKAHPKGLALWLDYSATPQQGDLFFPWIIVDYPLAQAVEDRIVKAPVIVRQTSKSKTPPQDPIGVNKDNVCDKYGYWIQSAVARWKVHCEAYKPVKLNPVLFIMVERANYADAIGQYLIDAHDFKEEQVLVIHTNTDGEITAGDLEKARIAANEIDKPNNKIRAIVSVMILKEGWDVRNVTVVLGLRPFDTAILPQQVIGRGLRLMDRTAIGPDRTQTLEVLGTKNLLQTLKDNLESEGVGVGDTGTPPAPPITVAPTKERSAHDIWIPLTKPSLIHNIQKLADVDVLKIDSILEDADLSEVYRIELQMHFGTTQTHVGMAVVNLGSKPIHETLAYLTNRVADMAKLGGRFAELYPLVKTYVENRCFGRTVSIDAETDEGKKVAEYLTRQDIRESVAKRLAHRLATLLVDKRALEFEKANFKLSATKPFTWRRNLSAGPLSCTKTVFNYVATYNDFERRFAVFLDNAKDVKRFAALGTTEQGDSNTAFRVDYLKPTGAIGFYYPDWVAVQQTAEGETTWIIETKGRIFDAEQVKAKDDAITDWCERIGKETGTKWAYIRINQSTFEGNPCSYFSELVHITRGGLLAASALLPIAPEPTTSAPASPPTIPPPDLGIHTEDEIPLV